MTLLRLLKELPNRTDFKRGHHNLFYTYIKPSSESGFLPGFGQIILILFLANTGLTYQIYKLIISIYSFTKNHQNIIKTFYHKYFACLIYFNAKLVKILILHQDVIFNLISVTIRLGMKLQIFHWVYVLLGN